MMSQPPRAASEPLAKPGRLSRLSKKLKRETLAPMSDLAADAAIVDCPPQYECYISMKPYRKHRLNIAKRYIAKVCKGMMRLILEKNLRSSNDALAAEFTIDLSAVTLMCDDVRKRIIVKYKYESHQISPVNKDEYEACKEMLHKHRMYRQYALKSRNDIASELIDASANPASPTPAGRAHGSCEMDSMDPNGNPRDDSRVTLTDLCDKVTRIANEIKLISSEMKLMRRDLKDFVRNFGPNKVAPKEQQADKQPSATEEESDSDDSDDSSIHIPAESKISQTTIITPKITPSREQLKAKDEKAKPTVKGSAFKGTPSAEKTKPDKKSPPLPKRKTTSVEGADKKDGALVSPLTPPGPIEASRKRREQLPKPAPPGEELGLRAMMAIMAKRMPLPITFFEPLGVLQLLCEEVRYANITLNKVVNMTDAIERMSYVTAFAVSAYSNIAMRKQKPFNPLLGETMDFVSADGWKFHAEQVSHHPPVSAAHAEGNGWMWWQTLVSNPRTGWSGAIEATPELPVRLRLGKEDYCWNKVKVIIENAAAVPDMRRLKIDGTMSVRCSNGLTSTIIFRRDRQTEITGSVMDTRGILVLKLNGLWDKCLQRSGAQNTALFEAIPLPKNADKYYGFSQFASGLNDLLPDERPSLPSTDSRLRPDMRALETGDVVKAATIKQNLEKAQRARSEQQHKRLWFEQKTDSMSNTSLWMSNGRYWIAKDKQFKGYTDILQLFW